MAAPEQNSKAWYDSKIEKVPEDTREILEKYSGIAPQDVTSHIEAVRREAFKLYQYPCIGQLRFLDLNLSKNPLYSQVLERLKNGQTFVDIGCCLGTDIRKLVVDGAPPGNVFGIELEKKFIDYGYELFRDEQKIPHSTWFIEDMLQPDFGPELASHQSRVDIVNASSFFHLLGRDDQLTAARKIIKLLKRRQGSMLVGRHAGNIEPGEYQRYDGEKFFGHNEVSWDALWNRLGEETGTAWKTQSWLDHVDMPTPKMQAAEVPKSHPWWNPSMRRHTFVVTML